jgi:hypothetical protein
MSEITKETSVTDELVYGHTPVGLTVVQLTPLSFKCSRGVLVRSPGPGEPDANTDIIYVGKATVTADSDVKTGGFPIIPGGCLTLPVDDPSKIYVIAAAAGQTLAWMGV